MTRARKIRRALVLTVAFVGGLWIADRWMAARSLADDTTTTAPVTRAVSRPAVTPEVQAILDRLATAYAPKPLRVEGAIVSDFDVAGIVDEKSIAVSATAKSKDAYRHEAKDKILIAADGKMLHLFDVARNQYGDAKVDDTEPNATATRDDVRTVIVEQNPALFIAMGNNPIDAVSMDGAVIELLEPEIEKGKSFDRLASTLDSATRTVWIDRERGTIDRVAYDFVAQLKVRGAAEVKRASVTLQYSKTEVGGAAPDDSIFAFAPPADATPIARGRLSGETAGAEPSAIEGKVAADFELKNMDGKTVKLSDTKGSVVVLDFWATWCPPCRAGLPHLAKAAEKYASKGVTVYAINQQEERETVAGFLAEQKLSLVALLDTDGVVGKKYAVSGIPQTVVIGRDGKVQKVFVGFDESDTNSLPEAIEAALR